MWLLLVGVTFGLLALSRSEILQVHSRSCSYAGVFLVEGPQRHALSLPVAEKVCEQEGSSLASPQQVMEGYAKNMETCRYGWTNNGSVVILRHTYHENCAKNETGIFYIYVKEYELFDAYCYNDKAGPDKDCEKELRPFSDEPADPSPSPQDLLESDTEPDSSSKSPPTDPKDEDQTTSPDNGAALEIREPTTEAVIAPTEVSPEDPKDGTSVQGGDNSTAEVSFTAADLDPPTGSGMTPGNSEEDTASTAAPAGEPVKPQAPAESEEEKTETEPVGDDVLTPQQPSGKGRVQSPVEPNQDQESGASLDWLVIVGVIVAVVAILFVCVAVAKRKGLCGKRQTLMITSKEAGEGNGAAAVASSPHSHEREQEMVTLMNKEKIQENGNTEEFTVITLEESPDKEQQA